LQICREKKIHKYRQKRKKNWIYPSERALLPVARRFCHFMLSAEPCHLFPFAPDANK